MPIVGEGDYVKIEYSIPEEIKELVTYDFLKEFRNQLFRIHKHYDLGTFADVGIPINTSTAGWYTALGKACLVTHNESLFDYYRTLPWYDSDLFDSELAEMLVEQKLILDDAAKVIGEQLGIDPEDIVRCCDCGKIYTKDMTELVSEDDDDFDNEYEQYRCFCCIDRKNRSNKEHNVTDYYREIVNELDEYKASHPICNEEE